MEQLKSGWDLFFLPRTWHKRLNSSFLSLIPGIFVVGFFDLLCQSKSIFNDFIVGSVTGTFGKVILFILTMAVVGFLDVFCFAWPVADLCRYIARCNNKFIIPGFNIVLMKSYAYSHLLFYPVLLIFNPTGLEVDKLVEGTRSITQLIIITLYVWALLQSVIQLGIMLRTVSIKSKLEFTDKLVVALAIIIWMNLEGEAISYIIYLAYKMFGAMYGLA